MANKGLRSYTKQISQTIGDVAKVSVNVNKDDANMHILIPLFQTLGPNPLELSLIWNYQDRDRIGHFGKGCNINTYKDFSDNENYISVREADGSYTSYWDEKGYNEFRADENNITIIKHVTLIPGDSDEYTYEFKDQKGNRICYDNGNTYYPTSIEYANGEKTIFDGLNMDNGHGAKVTFTESNRLRTRVTYTQDGTTLYYVDFGYDSNQKLTSVKHYKESRLVKHLSITYGTNEITVKDVIRSVVAKYVISNTRITSITETLNGEASSERTTTIFYEDRRTKITDQEGNYFYIYFDSTNLPLFVIDQDGNSVKSKYNLTTKKLVSISPVIPTKNKFPNLCNITMASFTKTSGNVTTSIVNVNDSVLSSNLGTVYCVKGAGSLTYSLPTNGLAKDNIMLVLWGKQNSNYSTSSRVKVTLKIDESKTDYFLKTSVDGYFDMMVLGGTAVKSYSNISITITLTGSASIDIGGIQLLKKNFGAIYSYDTYGNIINMETGRGSISSSYNHKGQKESFLSFDSTIYDYEYDTKGNLTSVKTAFGGKIENTYDSYNNVIKRVASNSAATKKLELTRTYQNGKFISSEKDFLGNETSYIYDSFGKIKKVTDVLNATMEYRYDEFDNLTKIIFNNSDSVNYTYDSQNKLKTATLSNGTIYSFGYDLSNNLNTISINGVLIVTFVYDQKTGLITNQKYGSSGDYFKFIYDAKKLYITELHYNDNLKYKFTYDTYNRMIEVQNKDNEILKEYEYDIDGHVIKVTENHSSIDYGYDALGYINQKKKNISSKITYESFDSISRSKGFHPEAIRDLLQNNSNYVGCLFEEDTSVKNGKYTIKPEMYNGSSVYKSCTKNGFVPCVYVDSSYTMSYALPMENVYPLDTGCVAFWFKPTSNGIKYLFSVKAKNRYDYIGVYLNALGNLVLEVTDYKNNSQTLITTTGKVKLNNWNFFGLSYMNRDDGLSYSNVCEYALFLNAETKMFKKSNPRIIVEPNSGNYYIGYKYNGTSATYGLNSYITALMIGCKHYMTIGDMQKFYRNTKDYIFGLSYLQDNAVDFSATTLYNISETMLNQFDIFPLQNNVKSLKGTLPIAFDLRRVTDLDKDRTFNYNNKSRRYAYVADGKRLEYNLNMSDTGTIMMRIYFMEDVEKQCILQCKDSSNKTIGLYRNADGYLQIEINGFLSTTQFKVLSNEWHTIGFSFYEGSISDSLGNTNPNKMVRLYLDGNTTSWDKEVSTPYGKLVLSIGRQFKAETTLGNIGYLNTCYAMLGQIEMLAIREAYCEVSTLNTLSNELKCTTKVSEYDELGMLQKVVIRKGDSDLLTKTMNYQKRSASSIFISNCIEKEVIKYGSTTVNRSYGIDALGNVKSITDSIFGSHSYKYNERDFLEVEDGKKYEYDSNGNITKAGAATFTYDSIIKDRLKTVNGKEIIYGSNPLNPSKYNGNIYEFEGRQLTRFNNNYYTYNNQGLRVKKIINTMPIQYYYDRDKLITEISPFYRLDFLYDEYDELYGLIFNETQKYFYIKDHLQNILGIVDTDGVLVVKYSCDAWGNHIVLDNNNVENTSHNFIGNLNPFRYKGYYYDTESNMYYCKSRYYVPEWCRWLNADSIVFNFKMGFGAINCCNVFNYCFNNPSIYSDLDGLYPKEACKTLDLYDLYSIGYQFEQRKIQNVQFIKKNNLIPHSLPTKGVPGSVGKQVKSDGTPHREREYDENGDAKVDHDHHEGEDAGYDHDHEWDWSNTEKPRGDAKPSKPSTNSFSIDSGSFISGAAVVLGGGAAGLVFACFVDEGFLGFNKFR
ncbi:MAG: hypothetical protein HFG91_05650 [Acholeplasmatales bacterium]|jgi:RHS repeat-associated protein|nr:hypothetical protein [Acholeplasmatales bacterium]